jgi:hypothetical protein
MVQQVQVNGEQVIRGTTAGLVASRSQPGLWHSVRIVDGVTVCDCLGYQQYTVCRHVRAFRLASTVPAATNPTFEHAEKMLAGAFEGRPKRREDLSIDDVIKGENVTFAEWRERHVTRA